MRVAVIGTGFGKHAAAPAYTSLGCEVDVVSPRDEAAVRRALDGEVDLVSVHSPPFLHVDHVLAAVDAGRAVLCDKPFGCTAADARTMRDRAADAGVAHFLNFEFRFKDSWARLKELADSGAIGTPRHLAWSFWGRGLRGRKLGWINDAELGGGWIGAYGSHIIDFTRWLFGSEIADCGGVTRADVDGATAEDSYSAWFVLANGATAAHDTGFAAPVASPPRVTLTGSDGVLELTGDTNLVLRRPREEPVVEELPGDTALHTYFGHVLAAVRAGTPLAPSFDDGVAVAEAMDRLRGNAIRAAR